MEKARENEGRKSLSNLDFTYNARNLHTAWTKDINIKITNVSCTSKSVILPNIGTMKGKIREVKL